MKPHQNRNPPRCPTWDYRSDGAYFITICTKNREHFFGKINNGKMELSPIGIIADILWYEIKNHAQNIELGEFVVMPNHIHGILILKNNLVWNPETKNEKSPSQNDENENSINPLMGNGPFAGDDTFVGDNPFVGNDPFVGTRHALSLQTDSKTNSKTNSKIDSKTNSKTNIQSDSKTNPQQLDIKTETNSDHIVQITNAQNPPLFADNRFQNQGKNSISSIVGSYKSAVTKHARRLGFDFYWQPRFWDNIIRNDSDFLKIRNYIVNNPLNWEEDIFLK